ncbi:MAG TPA: hypothetical protein GX391_08710 [Firmicutes bacterium]|nr:hypothetical protein [Bacillota bacterium]HOQ24604.1 DRTGG domain-containing protein [Bacillota bacterium]HPT67812.1 DRTGG domain-containing protein [Bacillota bacterium]
MNLAQVKELLQAEVLSGEEKLATTHALSVCGADLMSDVLAFTKEKTLLLTGLTNPQVIRTAEMIDLVGLVFVRGKRPSEDVIAMARERGLPMLSTKLPLYETCGLLYTAGLPGCSARAANG